MRECLILVTAIATIGSISNAAVYPWIPIAPWWVRAPEKDTPPVVSIQQLGGNYAYSTSEGKAFQALAPAAVGQSPVGTVHVQTLPGVAVHYLPGGQAVLVPAGSLAAAANPPSLDSSTDEGLETTTTEYTDEEASTDPAAVSVDGVNPEPPREPAPVTEHQEENEAIEN
ncbi:uncharacterized protein LOC128732641 [Sabethes cyaneus]|uniref:uncharacterized protein LOC128732641 n=1 Tax=Sabethes cyaneus TaxID=53552 RepID=UPI00237E9AC0|nr:uncharacterized protein LOC128732641 [Sabethes cyaneus]